MKSFVNPSFTRIIRILAVVLLLIVTVWEGYQLSHFLRIHKDTNNSVSGILSRCDPYKGKRHELQTCWKKVFEDITDKFGIDNALARLNELKNTNIEFAADCHVYAHKIGEKAYARYKGNPRFSISENTNLCNFGFYHGFMQEFASHNENLDTAREFCIRVLEETKTKNGILNPGIYGSNCDHGMGHGLAYKNAITHWGDENTIAQTSVADCKTLSKVDLRECINGVYGGIAAMYFELHGYKLSMDKNDPFRLCKERPQEELVLCYDSFVPPLHFTFDMDFDKAAAFILDIPDKSAALVAMRHLGTMPSHMLVPLTDNYSSMIDQCRKYPEDFHLACLKGFSGSLLQIGAYEEAQNRVLSFCMSDLSEQERRICYEGAVESLQYSNTRETVLMFCDRIDSRYRTICKPYLSLTI